jgi:hypothetical protein
VPVDTNSGIRGCWTLCVTPFLPENTPLGDACPVPLVDLVTRNAPGGGVDQLPSAVERFALAREAPLFGLVTAAHAGAGPWTVCSAAAMPGRPEGRRWGVLAALRRHMDSHQVGGAPRWRFRGGRLV